MSNCQLPSHCHGTAMTASHTYCLPLPPPFRVAVGSRVTTVWIESIRARQKTSGDSPTMCKRSATAHGM
jgi:hypothetical protein